MDIQRRIADAIKRQAQLDMECDRDIEGDPHDHWMDLAAAVVSELGLTREDASAGITSTYNYDYKLQPHSRYVTEWVADA